MFADFPSPAQSLASCALYKDTLQLGPKAALVFTAVDARACAQKKTVRIPGVYSQTHDVGIVDQPRRDGLPIFAAVRGLPWQVVRADINDVCIARIDGQRIHVPQFRIRPPMISAPKCSRN